MVQAAPDLFTAVATASPKEGVMKRISKITAVAFLFAAVVTAMPRLALAQTGMTVAPASLKGEATDTEHKDWIVVVATAVTAVTEVVI